jgi:hypothetical protein
MKTHAFLRVALCLIWLLLALPGIVRALPPAESPVLAGATIPYPGRLSGPAGAADGAYDFRFALYASATGGESLWSEAQPGLPVAQGAFDAVLGSVNPIPTALLTGERWLAIALRGPGESSFVDLSPRQKLSAAATTERSAGASPCAHDHVGETWTGNGGLSVRNTATTGVGVVGVHVPTGNYAESGTNLYGLHAVAFSGIGIYGQAPANDGVRGDSDAANRSGVYGFHTATGMGVTGRSVHGTGVYAESGGQFHENAALRAVSTNVGQGVAGYFVNNGAWPTIECDQNGNGRVLDLQNHGDNDGNGGGDFLACFSKDAELQFRVASNGQARSDVGFATPAEDFAELLPAVNGLEAGDVLAIGLDGKLTRSTAPYQTSVAGVYSTQPGFLGGQPVDGAPADTIPLAVVGVVPVKVTAEGGAIVPGDLLVASSTPGRAMKAGPHPPLGSVLGKALQSLASGSGVIKMLATLQ